MTRQRVRLDDDPTPANGNSLGDDMLIGAKPIARFLRGDDSREAVKWTYRAADRKLLPIGKIGGRLIASRKSLTAAFERLTSGEAE